MTSNRQPSNVTDLAGARMPADHGLTSLGLLMQMGGALFLGISAGFAAIILLSGAGVDGVWKLFLIFGVGAIRSSYHYNAGRALVHGVPPHTNEGPLSPIRKYINIAVVHTILSIVVLQDDVPNGALLVGMIATSMVWPITLYVLLHSQHVKRLDEIPRSEDLGLEGASMYMLLFGIVGTMFCALMLYQFTQTPTRHMPSIEELAIYGTLILLTVRSIFHVAAGKRGITGDLSATASDTRRYTRFASSSTVLIGLLLFLWFGFQGIPLSGFVFLAMLVYLMLAWPRIIARFMDQREVDQYTVGNSTRPRRPPDMGLTALGWLLLAVSVHQLAGAIPHLFSEHQTSMTLVGLTQLTPLTEVLGRSIWLHVLVSGVQCWAALQLIRMTDEYKLAALIYSVLATSMTLYMVWPVFENTDFYLRSMFGTVGLSNVMFIGHVGVALTLPVSVFILVRRDPPARAVARIRNADSE